MEPPLVHVVMNGIFSSLDQTVAVKLIQITHNAARESQ